MPKGDRDILKADIDDGYTTIANLLLEALAMANISGVQKGLVLFLMRRTYGWVKDNETNERFKEDRITLNEWTAATDSERTYVAKQLRDLIDNKRIINERPDPEDKRYRLYSLNTNVEQWDNGCLNKQRLSKNATQGLFKHTTISLSKKTTVDPPETPGATGSGASPKESIKTRGKEKGLPPLTPPKPETIEDVLAQFPRYSKEQLTLIREYWDMIRFTRKTGNVAHSIVLREMQYWERFSVETVLEAIKLHLQRYQTKQEDYTRGIMRRLEREKAQKGGLASGRAGPAQKDYSLRLEQTPKRDYTRGLPM